MQEPEEPQQIVRLCRLFYKLRTDPSLCDDVLEIFDDLLDFPSVKGLSIPERVTILTMTAPYRDRLKNRQAFYARTRELAVEQFGAAVEQRGAAEVDKLLIGLE